MVELMIATAIDCPLASATIVFVVARQLKLAQLPRLVVDYKVGYVPTEAFFAVQV
jgi:hypothetical protein